MLLTIYSDWRSCASPGAQEGALRDGHQRGQSAPRAPSPTLCQPMGRVGVSTPWVPVNSPWHQPDRSGHTGHQGSLSLQLKDHVSNFSGKVHTSRWVLAKKPPRGGPCPRFEDKGSNCICQLQTKKPLQTLTGLCIVELIHLRLELSKAFYSSQSMILALFHKIC